MRMFLLHRMREGDSNGTWASDSVWSSSMYREFVRLGATIYYDSLSEFVRAYKDAFSTLPHHLKQYVIPLDKAPPSAVLAFDTIFGGRRPATARNDHLSPN